MRSGRTGYRLSMLRTLSSSYEDNILLTDVGVPFLQVEHLVHAVVLQRRELDKQSDRAS